MGFSISDCRDEDHVLRSKQRPSQIIPKSIRGKELHCSKWRRVSYGVGREPRLSKAVSGGNHVTLVARPEMVIDQLCDLVIQHS